MRSGLALAVVLATACAACDRYPECDTECPGWGATDAMTPVDAPPHVFVCDPAAPAGAQGCAAGQKCAWVTLVDWPLEGDVRCVPDGVVAYGGACTRGAAGDQGYDDCVAGTHCITGECRAVCREGETPCAVAGFSCAMEGPLFAYGDEPPVAGVCWAACDPFTSELPDGTTCGAGYGCYLVLHPDGTYAACQAAGSVGPGETITGPIVARACRPGATPRQINGGEWRCVGLCRPATVTIDEGHALEGGVAPYTCAAQGAAPPDDPSAGTSCRYWFGMEGAWWWEEPSRYSDTMGFCMNHALERHDSDRDGTLDAPMPRCPTVSRGDEVAPLGYPADDDARGFFCAPRGAR